MHQVYSACKQTKKFASGQRTSQFDNRKKTGEAKRINNQSKLINCGRKLNSVHYSVCSIIEKILLYYKSGFDFFFKICSKIHKNWTASRDFITYMRVNVRMYHIRQFKAWWWYFCATKPKINITLLVLRCDTFLFFLRYF